MFYKKLVVALFAALLMSIFAPKAKTEESSIPIIRIIPFIGPAVPYSGYSSTFLNNAINGIRNNLPSAGNPSNPAFWKPLVGNQVTPGQIVLTYDVTSWNGLVNPSGSFSGEYGNMLYFGYDIISATPFSFNEITFHFESDGFDNENTFEQAGATYRLQAKGINWGPDNIEGTADDEILGPGDENLFANRITGIGLSYARSTEATTQAEMQESISSFIRDGIDPITVTYSIIGFSGSATLTVVPEPSTWSISGIFVIATWWLRRKELS